MLNVIENSMLQYIESADNPANGGINGGLFGGLNEIECEKLKFIKNRGFALES
jgi:hypothetical protein